MLDIELEKCLSDGCDAVWWTASDETDLSFDAVLNRQKSRDFFETNLPPDVLDSMCDVPSIPEDDTYESLADKCLRGMGEWQRQLDPDRVRDIGLFWSSPGSNIVNPAIIAFTEGWEVKLQELDLAQHTSLSIWRITVKSWFRKRCPKGHSVLGNKAADRCPEHSCHHHRKPYEKPAVIIDGQHRIRGTASDMPVAHRIKTNGDTYASRIPFPVNILAARGPNAFDTNAQARIFTEITTKAEDLYYLHKLWLLYRFPGMQAEIEELDLPQPVNMDSGDSHGKLVRTAYESILWVVGSQLGSSGSGNPWRGMVPIFRPRQKTQRIASVDRLLPMIYSWARPKGPLAGKLPQQIATELREYILAIIKTWNRMSPSGRFYWIPPFTPHRPIASGDRGIISNPEGGAMSTWFRALIRLLPSIYGRLPTSVSSPTSADFETIFQHLSHCNFDGPGWEDFPGQETRENLLFNILNSYLTGGTVTQEMALAGIASLNDYVRRPPEFDVRIDGDGGAGSKTGSPLVISGQTKLSWRRPFNTLGDSVVNIIQEGRVEPYEQDIKIERGNSIEFTLQSPMYEPSLAGRKVDIRIRQYNHVGTTTRICTFEVP